MKSSRKKTDSRQFDVNNVPRPLGGLAAQIAHKNLTIERKLRIAVKASSEKQNGYHVDAARFQACGHKKEACVDAKLPTDEAWAWPN